jgi:hypothetical protein
MLHYSGTLNLELVSEVLKYEKKGVIIQGLRFEVASDCGWPSERARRVVANVQHDFSEYTGARPFRLYK